MRGDEENLNSSQRARRERWAYLLEGESEARIEVFLKSYWLYSSILGDSRFNLDA